MASRLNYYLKPAVITVAILLMCSLTDCYAECVADGEQSYSLIKNINDTITQLEWVAYSNGYNDSVILCSCNMSGCQGNNNCTITLSKALITQSSLILGAANLTRLLHNYSVSYLRQAFVVCTYIHIYVKPKNMSCGTPVLNSSSNGIDVSCIAKAVSPSAKCLVYTSTDDTTFLVLGTNTQCFNDSSKITVCNVSIPILSLGEGNHFLTINMYPDVIGGSDFGVNSTASSQIKLYLPVTDLNECPDFYKGYYGNCQCKLLNTGNPIGKIQWYDSKGYQINTTNSQLNVSHDKDSNTFFVCKGISELGTEINGTTFMPRFAYGPFSLAVTADKKTVDLCTATSTITVNCSILRSTVNPVPKVEFAINGVDFTIEDSQVNDKMNYTFQHSFVPSSSGNITILCRATNSQFSDLNCTGSLSAFVREPPSQFPVIEINGNALVSNSKEGEDANITCFVKDGVPLVSYINLSCGTYINSSSSSTISLFLKNITRYLNEKLCTCEASHVTNCYHKNSTARPLIVTYPPVITRFEVNSNRTLYTTNGSSLIFSCSIDSNPPPLYAIYKNLQDFTIANASQVIAFCNSTGKYSCRANNVIFNNASALKEVEIYVLCPQQFKDEQFQENIISSTVGSNVYFKIKVYGYPKPNEFNLLKMYNNSQFHLKNISLNNNDDYEDTKIKIQYFYDKSNEPDGIVNCTIFNIEDSDFGNYKLKIENGIGHGLVYTFKIIEDTQNSSPDYIPAAVGGGIAFAFGLILAVIFAVKGKNCQAMKKRHFLLDFKVAEKDVQNADIYFVNLKGTSEVVPSCKTYHDVITTITTASAFPQNMKLKPKPAAKPEYFNTISGHPDNVFTQVSDKQNLIKKDTDTSPCFTNIFEENSKDIDVYANMNA